MRRVYRTREIDPDLSPIFRVSLHTDTHKAEERITLDDNTAVIVVEDISDVFDCTNVTQDSD